MNNNGPKLVRIPLKTEQEFYKRNIPIIKITSIILCLIATTTFLIG